MTDDCHPEGLVRRRTSAGVLFTVALLLVGTLVVSSGGARAQPRPESAIEFVNISATGSLNFVPDTFTVVPGTTVHLMVTQLADFDHTFTLSPAANTTISSSDSPTQLADFFNAHTPLVNLSLGSTPGAQFEDTFTAPTVLGDYEYVCLIHFPTMTGEMVVSNAAPSSGSSSGPSTLEVVGIGAVVGVVVVVLGVALWSRSRGRSGSGGGEAPAK